ncbi:MAG: ABC transporter permease [Bryobacterales bacterium]|nr:ABC transporter permease [Bryobacterales bacterium]
MLGPDITFAWRQIRRSPMVSITAILSLALGIGSATAMFSVIHGVVIDPFPYKDVDSLMSVRVSEPGQRGGRTGYTVDQFLDLREHNGVFSAVTASTISDVFWTGRAQAERLRGNHTTYDGLSLMGVPAMEGRIFTTDDTGQDVCVLGFRFWQRQFGGDQGVLGQRLLLNGKFRTVVGVMPPRFMWRGADVYLPIEFRRGVTEEGVRFVHVLGRLKPNVSEAQAEADLRPIVEEMQRQAPASFPSEFRVGLLSFSETFPSGITEELWALFTAVGLLLLITCANVSNLFLAQSLQRAKEMAIRVALGARKLRLVRQLLTESIAVAMAGGLLGVALAWVGMHGILLMVPPFTIPDEADVRLNLAVLGFAAAVSMLTAILFGMLPAIRTASGEVVGPLKEGGRTGISRRDSWISGGLVVSEVGLSLVLLFAAALVVGSLMKATSQEYGVDTAGVLTARIPLDPNRYAEPARRRAMIAELIERLRGNPDVVAVGVNTGTHPFGNSSAPVEIPGIEDKRPVFVHPVSPDYPRVFGIPLRHGRAIDEGDMQARRFVAMVSESFVARYFPRGDALGAHFRVPRLSTEPFGLENDSFEIVGVVSDTQGAFTRESRPEVYIPVTLAAPANFALAARARTGDGSALASIVRAEVSAIDKDQPVMDAEPIDRFIARYVVAGPKFGVVLFGIFGVLGLALVTVGIYGVISNGVARRVREFGIRMALGATVTDVIRDVVLQASRLIGLGLIAGLAGAVVASRYLGSLFRDADQVQLVPALAGCVLLIAVGLFASWVPARRAGRIEPVSALRED